jgi:hypothetical protein
LAVPTRRKIPGFELEKPDESRHQRPAATPAFDADCASGCTVLTCSCTATTFDRIHWTSSASVSLAPYAWRVDFNSGDVNSDGKETPSTSYVRAVRGGA